MTTCMTASRPKLTRLTIDALRAVPRDWTPCAWPDHLSCRSIDAVYRHGLVEFKLIRRQWNYRRTAAGNLAL